MSFKLIEIGTTESTRATSC